ncbi:MAG TPA: hypothetical protein VH023_16505 [Rhodopila sp.]|nr:hypothetical protein [Rhodopila sp.]
MGRWTAPLAGLLLVSSPAFAGPPFRTDDPEPVDFQHFEINLISFGTQTSGGWSGVLPELEVNYGVLPNLQLHAIVPQGYSAPAFGRGGVGLGDVELGVEYRFITPGDNDWFPKVAVFPTVEVPAGDQKLGFSTGHAQFFLPLWLQKDFGRWTVYGGGGYWINPGIGNRNYSFVGAVLSRQVTEKLSVGVEVFHQTSSGDGIKDSTGFNVGGIYDFSERWHLLSSVGSGIQNGSETDRLSYLLGLRLTF